MKIVYKGVDYKQVTAQRGAALLHIIEMQAQSKRADLRALLPDGETLGLGTLHRWAREAEAYGRAVRAWERGGKTGDEPSPPECAVWLQLVNLFLTLRAGGWEGTVLDAAAIPPIELRWVREVLDGATDEPDDDESDDATGEASDPTLPASPGGPATSASDVALDVSPEVEAVASDLAT